MTDQFQLDPLEPRLLLSGDPVAAAVAPAAPTLETAAIVIDVSNERLSEVDVMSDNSSLFEGTDGDDFFVVEQLDGQARIEVNGEFTTIENVETLLLDGGEGDDTLVFVGDANVTLDGVSLRANNDLQFAGFEHLEVTTSETLVVKREIALSGTSMLSAWVLELSAGINIRDGDLVLTASEISITDDIAVNNGRIVVQPADPAQSVQVASAGAATFDLSAAELDLLHGDLVIGRQDGQSVIDIGAYTFSHAVTFRAPEPGGRFRILGPVTSNEALLFEGSGATQFLQFDIVTSGDQVLIDDSVEIVETATSSKFGAGKVYIDTTADGSVPTGADIFVTGAINGTAGGDGESIYLNAGSTGDIHIQGAVGGSVSLEDFYIINARNVLLDGILILSQDLVQVTGTGGTTFKQDVIAGRNVIVRTTASIAFENDLQADTGDIALAIDSTEAATTGLLLLTKTVRAPAGYLRIEDAKTARFQDAVTLGGALVQTRGSLVTQFDGRVSAAAVDLTATQQIQFLGEVTVAAGGDVRLQSNEIDFQGGALTVSGTGTLEMLPAAANVSIDIGSPVGGSGILDIGDTDLASFANGFDRISIGMTPPPVNAAASQNGLYAVTTVGGINTPWVLERVTAFDTDAEIFTGETILISAGDLYTGQPWQLTSSNAITLDISDLEFFPVSALDQSIVRVASTANLGTTYAAGTKALTATADGAITIDGVTLVANDRVLVKDQGTATQNGIYVVTDTGTLATKYVLTRATDFDADGEVAAGHAVVILEGTAGAGETWRLLVDLATLDTTALDFRQSNTALAARVATPDILDAAYDGAGKTLTASTNGAVVIDGIALALNDQVLVKSQSATVTDHTIVAGTSTFRDPLFLYGATATIEGDLTLNTDAVDGGAAENGVYTVTAKGDANAVWVLTRATDFDEDSEIFSGVYTSITEGTALASQSWELIGSDPLMLTSDEFAFQPQTHAPGTGTVGVATTAALGATFNGTDKTLTANANGILNVDGVALVVDDELLLKDQADATQNGVYRVTAIGAVDAAWVIVRADTFDTDREVSFGHEIAITAGSANGAETWRLISANPILLNTTELTFVEHAVAVQKTAVRVATTATLDASYDVAQKTLTALGNAAIVIDGVTLDVNDRLLVKNQWAGQMVSIRTRTGNVNVNNDAEIVVGVGSATVTADTGSVVFGNGAGMQVAGSVRISAAAGSVVRTTDAIGTVAAGRRLAVSALADIVLNTAATAAWIASSGIGEIEIAESDGITLASVTTANGPITISAGDTVNAVHVTSTTDADANDISVTLSEGHVEINAINAGATGDVSLAADAGAIRDATIGEATNIFADIATLVAAFGIGATGAGDLDVELTGELAATNNGATGDIVVTQLAAAGALTATGLTQNGAGSGGIEVIVQGGALTVTQNGASIAASGNVLLKTETQGGNHDITLDAIVATVGGEIRVIASAGVAQNRDISSAGFLNVSGIAAAVTMASGVKSQTGAG